jgi:uncharacterized repeat protein (TIGR03847 family)
MPRLVYLFDPPERFVAGTVGEPGNRTFFLQAREGTRIVSVALEKIQVAALAERLGTLLEELESRGIAPAEEPPGDDPQPLDEPLREAFRAGTLTLGWEGDTERVLVEAQAQTDDEDEDEEIEADDSADGPDILRVRITADAARAFVARANRVVAAGRPPCPLCGQPLDALGHICPRRNGHFVN